MKPPSCSWGSLFSFALSWHFWKQRVAGRNHWAVGCSLCAQCESQTKTLCFPYIHSNLREKMWSSGGAQLLPRPHYDSTIETSVILWARPNLSLPPLIFQLVYKSLVFSLPLVWDAKVSNISTHQRSHRLLADQAGEKHSPLCLQDKSQFSHLSLTKLLDVTDDPGVGQDCPSCFAFFVFIVSCQRLQMTSAPLCVAFIL